MVCTIQYVQRSLLVVIRAPTCTTPGIRNPKLTKGPLEILCTDTPDFCLNNDSLWCDNARVFSDSHRCCPSESGVLASQCQTEAVMKCTIHLNTIVLFAAPHIHAHSLELLEDHLSSRARALDIKSGTGYLTACMGLMVKDEGGKVVEVEQITKVGGHVECG